MKRTLAVIVGAGLLVAVGAMFGPRAAHAIVATLVNVVNPRTNPVPVREANSPDIYPFVLSFCTNRFVAGQCTFVGASNGGSATIPSTTPDGVAVLFADIDNFSATCAFPSNNATNQEVSVSTAFQGLLGGDPTIPFGTFGTWAFPVPPVNTGLAITNQPTRIYADPGSTISISQNFTSSPASPCAVTLSGHLVTQ
jgi:hypothetical protein